MTQPKDSLPPSYFEDMYRQDPDPWDFETSDYEALKISDYNRFFTPRSLQ